jgi:hypothetical protein
LLSRNHGLLLPHMSILLRGRFGHDNLRQPGEL